MQAGTSSLVKRVAVLLSGGVDSSVALRLLRDQGRFQLTAFYLKIWLEDEMAFLGRCPWQEDLEYVRRTCAATGTPIEVVSLQREYFQRVVSYAIDELRAGRTPSPDILCNRRIKFGAFVDAIAPDFDAVASGHYARVVEGDGLWTLHRGVDPVKDQTYFLCLLDQRQLGRCLFPVGGLTKTEVRSVARQAGLPASGRPDSQGICFLGRLRYDDFVRFHLGDRPGEIRDISSGRVVGEHRGYWYHTIGQRRGLGLGGGPWYVVDKSVDDNVVFVCHATSLGERGRRRFRVDHPHWIAAPPSREQLHVRVRHGQTLHQCRVRLLDGGAVAATLQVSDPGLAPGQFAVFYDGDCCLGGGAMV
jgi:tRNA-specific 2-thiouridylase